MTDPNPQHGQTAKGTYAFVSLGCPKNLVDSEKMLGHLAIDGFQVVSEPEGADFVVVNTCGFIEQSRAESKAVIQEMLDLKKAGGTKGVIVAGCLPERLGGALLDEMPEIDHVVGVFGRDEIATVAEKLTGAPPSVVQLEPSLPGVSPLHREQRELRPDLHVLLDPQNARQARHQAHRNGDRRSPRTRHRRL
jgi:tRNA A37 methylthiotransferase MiaB